MSFKTLFRSLAEENESHSSLPMDIFLIGIVVLIIFVAGPFVATRERRNLCYRRFVERDWSVSDGENENPTIIPTLSVMRSTTRYVTKNK